MSEPVCQTFEDGRQEWRLSDGRLHRTDGPAVITPDGHQLWFIEGRPHRTDGPAYIWSNGGQEWWVDGQLHRTDGPAVIRAGGRQYWFIEDRHLTEQEFELYRFRKWAVEGELT